MDGVMNLKMITWVEWMTMTALGRLELDLPSSSTPSLILAQICFVISTDNTEKFLPAGLRKGLSM